MMPRGFFSYFYFLFFFYFCSWEGNSIGDFTLLPLRLTFQSNYMSAFNFLPQGNVKGVVSSVPFSSELARSPIKEIFLGGSCQLSHSTGTQGRIFTGEMAQLPGSYHHRLPMLREQTANYPSCRHLHSTWRESRGQWPRTAGRFRERAQAQCTPPAAPTNFSITQRALGEEEDMRGTSEQTGSAWLLSCRVECGQVNFPPLFTQKRLLLPKV